MTRPADSGPPFGADPEPSAIEQPDPTDWGVRSGPARVLAVLAAVLGLAVYQLGFLGDVRVTSTFGGQLLVGGGLLAASAVLPRAGRVLGPAAVLVVTGTLLLLQVVIGLGAPTVLVVAMVLAVLQSVAVVSALLLDIGLLAVRRSRARPLSSYPPGYQDHPAGPPAGGASGLGPGQFGSSGLHRTAGPARYPGPPPVAIGPGPPVHRSWPEPDAGSAPGVEPGGPGASPSRTDMWSRPDGPGPGRYYPPAWTAAEAPAPDPPPAQQPESTWFGPGGPRPASGGPESDQPRQDARPPTPHGPDER